MTQNPYQPPVEQRPSRPAGTASPGTCPSCGSGDFRKLGFTWWGGALGPRMLNHVKCNGCGATFNSKTGLSNTNGIIIYSVVVFVIAIALLVALYSARFRLF